MQPFGRRIMDATASYVHKNPKLHQHVKHDGDDIHAKMGTSPIQVSSIGASRGLFLKQSYSRATAAHKSDHPRSGASTPSSRRVHPQARNDPSSHTMYELLDLPLQGRALRKGNAEQTQNSKL